MYNRCVRVGKLVVVVVVVFQRTRGVRIVGCVDGVSVSCGGGVGSTVVAGGFPEASVGVVVSDETVVGCADGVVVSDETVVGCAVDMGVLWGGSVGGNVLGVGCTVGVNVTGASVVGAPVSSGVCGTVGISVSTTGTDGAGVTTTLGAVEGAFVEILVVGCVVCCI